LRKRVFAGFEVTAWDALFAPRGTPKSVIDKLNAAVRKALDDAQLRAASGAAID
jgi:tripartite-type tricarboxylate transporter receptor subunit TctC